MSLTHTIGLLELLWTLITLTGVGFSIVSLAASVIDQRLLANLDDFIPGGPRDIIAKSHLHAEIIRGLVLSCLTGVGFIAMTVPPSGGSHEHATAGLLVGVFLVASAVLLVVGSIIAFLSRQAVINLVSKTPLHDPPSDGLPPGVVKEVTHEMIFKPGSPPKGTRAEP